MTTSFRLIRDVVSDSITATDGNQIVVRLAVTVAIVDPAILDVNVTRLGDKVTVSIPNLTTPTTGLAAATGVITLTALPVLFRPKIDTYIPVLIHQNLTQQIGVALI